MSPHEGQEEFEEVNEELRKREEVEGRGGNLEQGHILMIVKFNTQDPGRE